MTANRLMSMVTFVAALGGFGIAAYLTSVHYASVPLTCSGGGSVVDCERVLSSSYSEVIGIPWAAGGLVWFGISGATALLVLTRRYEPEWLHPAQLAWSLIGIATVLYLVSVEAVQVGRICLWCTAMHVLIATTLLMTLFRTPHEVEEEPEQSSRRVARTVRAD